MVLRIILGIESLIVGQVFLREDTSNNLETMMLTKPVCVRECVGGVDVTFCMLAKQGLHH